MNQREIVRLASGWLNDLRKITAAGNEPVTKEQLAIYLRQLIQEFDASCFTDASLKHVADGCEFFPKWAVLRAGIIGWRDRQMAVGRLPAPISDSVQRRIDEIAGNDAYRARLAAEREDTAASWRGITAEGVRQKVRALDGHPMRADCGKLLGRAVARFAPDLLEHLPPEFHPDVAERVPPRVVRAAMAPRPAPEIEEPPSWVMEGAPA